MSQLLRFPTLEGCKVSSSPPLAAEERHVVHTTAPAPTVADIPAKSKLMMKAELPCQKVIDARRKKEEAQVRKAAAGGTSKKRTTASEGGSSRATKKKAVEHMSEPDESSNHVSSPDPLHTVEPLRIEEDAERLANLRHQEDEFHMALDDQEVNRENDPPVQQGANQNALVISVPSHTTFPSGLFQLG